MAASRNSLKCVSSFEELSMASIIWEIRHLDIRDRRNIISSANFYFENSEATKWRLQFPSTCKRNLGPVPTLCDLILMTSDKFPLRCKIDWRLLNDKHQVIGKNSSFQCQFETPGQLIDLHGTHYDYGDIDEEIYSGTKIIIQVDVCHIADKQICTKSRRGNKDHMSLLEDLRGLLNAKDTADLTLSVAGRKLKVHRAILIARSPVLAAMLVNRKSSELHIPEVSLDVMERVIRYMYTDEVDDIKAKAAQLYPVACRYALSGLKSMCEGSMEELLTVKNAAQTLVRAEGDFKARVIDFMKSHSKQVTATAGFKAMALAHPQLLLDVFCAIDDDGATSSTA